MQPPSQSHIPQPLAPSLSGSLLTLPVAPGRTPTCPRSARRRQLPTDNNQKAVCPKPSGSRRRQTVGVFGDPLGPVHIEPSPAGRYQSAIPVRSSPPRLQCERRISRSRFGIRQEFPRMQFYFFHLMPWPFLPDDFDQKYDSAWVWLPNSLYDPVKGHDLYRAYIDVLAYADELGFDGVCVNEHHQNAYGLMPSPNVIAGALTQRTKNCKIAVIG